MRQWILDRWLVYGRVLLLAGIFLSPVVFWRSTVDVFNLLKMTVIWVTALLGLMFLIGFSAERGVWAPKIRLGLAAIAFLVVSALATYFSDNPPLSLTGLYHRYGGLLPFAIYAGVLYLIVSAYWEEPHLLSEVAGASAAASMVMLTYVLIQAAGLDWINWQDASGQPPPFPVGTMGNSNFAGGYLGIGLPFLIYTAMSAKKEWLRTVLFVFVGLDMLAIWFTQTRGGMIAGGVGLVALIFLNRERIPRIIRMATTVGVGVAVVLSAILLADIGSARSRLARVETFRTGTFDIRTFYWTTAWRIFIDNPILGTGLETYYANYPQYRLEEDGAQLGLTITDKPHNIFLEYASNAGLLGLVSYLALVGLGLWFGLSGLKRGPPELKLLLSSFIAVLLGYLAQGFFSIDVPPLAVMGWIALGGIAAIADPAVLRARAELIAEQSARPSKKGAKAQRRPRRPKRGPHIARRGPTRWGVHAVVMVLVAVLVILGLFPLIADVRAKEGQTLQVSKRPAEEVLAKYQAASRLNPLEPSYLTLQGSLLENRAANTEDVEQKKALLERALDLYRQAFALQEGNVYFLMNMARVYTTWGEQIDKSAFTEADRWWKRAAEHDPVDWDVQNRYALMLNSWANAEEGSVILRERTLEQLQKVVSIRPDYVPGWINIAKVSAALGNTEEALEAAERALELEPDNEEAQQLASSLQGQ